MPVRSLTDAERGRLSGFPQEIPEDELFSYFSLSGTDRAVVPERTSPAIRLGFAVSLCAVRYLGFCPEDLVEAPKAVLWYVGDQVGAPAEAIERYGIREQTRSDHLKVIYEHLGYRRPTEEDLSSLTDWLVERALEHEDQALLVSLAAEKLKAGKFVRPALYRLERMASSARERAVEETYHGLSPILTGERIEQLDRLLVPVASVAVAGHVPTGDGIPQSVRRRGLTPLSWLKDRATSNSPRAILDQIKKLSHLRSMGVDGIDTSRVNPNRLKFLASVGRRYTNQALQRQTPERRYPVLLAFLKEALTEITDEVVDIFDQCLWDADRRAKNELAEFRQGAAKATDEKVRLFNGISGFLLDSDVPAELIREKAFALAGSEEELREAREDSERLLRPLDDNYYDFFANKYSYVRQFAPTVLDSLEFRSNKPDNPLLTAVSVLRELNDSGSRKVPEDAPLEFVPAGWLPYVAGMNHADRDGLGAKRTVDRHQWELCLLWELRGALRSGDVWVEGARRYANPQSFLIPEEEWPSLKQEVRLLTGVPSDGTEHLQACRQEMENTMSRLKDHRLPWRESTGAGE